MSFSQILPLFQGTFTVVLFILVLRQNNKNRATRLFATFLASMTLWGFFIAAMRLSPADKALWLEKIALIMIGFTAVFFYLFAIQYAKLKSRLGVLLCSLYLLAGMAILHTSLMVKGMGTDQYGNEPIWGLAFYAWVAIIYTLIIVAMARLNTGRKAATSYEEKNRYLFFIVGAGFCLLGGVFDILPTFGVPVYPGSIIGNVGFAALTTWAILQYHLFDIQVVAGRSLSYLLTTIIIMIPLAGLMGLWLRFATSWGLPIWLMVLPLLSLVLLTPPTWQSLEAMMTRRILPQRHAHLKALDEFSHLRIKADDPMELYSAIVNLTNLAVRPLFICLLVRTENGSFNPVQCLKSPQEIALQLPADHPVVSWLERNMSLLWARQFESEPELQVMTDKDREVLSKADGQMYYPLGGVELVGILILGRKSSGQVYTRDDLDFLVALTRQTSLELENIHLFNRERAQRKRVETFNTERSTFLDALAHELKTPLTSALSSSELLVNELRNHPENLRLLSEDVWTATKGLEQIVNDVLDFGKSQETRFKGSLGRVDLRQLGLEMKDEFSNLLRTNRQALSITLPDAPVWTRADPLRMKQVLRNLLSNAAKFSPHSSNIYLRITALERSAQIEVEDSAELIDPQEQEHLFTPYYRGTKAQEKHVPGLGLGLFISKRLVELQGGKIWLAQNEKRGNHFYILMPKE